LSILKQIKFYAINVATDFEWKLSYLLDETSHNSKLKGCPSCSALKVISHRQALVLLLCITLGHNVKHKWSLHQGIHCQMKGFIAQARVVYIFNCRKTEIGSGCPFQNEPTVAPITTGQTYKEIDNCRYKTLTK
jgi:hypothetical protein